MKTIRLTKGKVALVDDEDFIRVNTHKWAVTSGKHGNWYAYRKADGRMQLMHHFILGRKIRTDHQDRNGLNNQKNNLRQASLVENDRNRRAWPHSSRFKGVSLHKQTGKWRAQIKSTDRLEHLGLFESEHDAAQSYDCAATRYFGQFACTNKMLGLL